MMTQKKTQDDSQAQRDAGTWLYDFIMETIEPDLTSENVEILEEKYTYEEDFEREARLERYEKAFAEFDMNLQQINDQLALEAREEKKSIRKKVVEKEQSQREEEAEQAEHLFDDDSDT